LFTTSVSAIAAFTGGVVSFFSPCVFPILPSFLAILMRGANSKTERFFRGVMYTVGLLTIFSVLGIAAGGVGGFLSKYRDIVNIVVGILFVVFGIVYYFEISLFRGKTKVYNKTGSLVSAFFMGIGMAFVWIPCTGPVLGAILLLAAQSGTVLKGAMLLALYSLGLSIPLIGLSWIFSKISSKISFGESKARKITRIVVSGLMILVGVLTMFGMLNDLQGFIQ